MFLLLFVANNGAFFFVMSLPYVMMIADSHFVYILHTKWTKNVESKCVLRFWATTHNLNQVIMHNSHKSIDIILNCCVHSQYRMPNFSLISETVHSRLVIFHVRILVISLLVFCVLCHYFV